MSSEQYFRAYFGTKSCYDNEVNKLRIDPKQVFFSVYHVNNNKFSSQIFVISSQNDLRNYRTIGHEQVFSLSKCCNFFSYAN